jgi:hypothetical protein
MKLRLLFSAALIAASTGLASAVTVFTENFGTLANGTTISTSNTGLTYVRVGTQGGSITALNPSTVGAGASALISGPTGGSLNGIGVGSGLDFGENTTYTMSFDFKVTDTSGTIVWGLGSGSTFTTNNAFATNQGLAWFQIDGTSLARRTSSAWSSVTSISINTAYTFFVEIDVDNNVMDIFLNDTLVADGVAVTTSNLTPDAFRIYSINGSDVEVDNIVITAIPEPTTALLGGLGFLALLHRRR